MKFSYSITIALAIITLNACDNAPISIPALPRIIPTPAPRVDNNTLPTGAEVQRANDLLNHGQRREAAKAYFNAAQKYRSPDKERLTLQAAELAVQISDRGLAQTYIATLSNSPLNRQTQHVIAMFKVKWRWLMRTTARHYVYFQKVCVVCRMVYGEKFLMHAYERLS